MAFAAFFARFAFCVSVVFPRTVASKPFASSPDYLLQQDAQSGCIWECSVVGSEFGLRMKSLISEYRLIALHLKYEQQVDKKCSNQTNAYNSSNKLAELWAWLTGENPSHGGQNMSQPSSSNNNSGTWFRKSLEGQIEVGVLCILNPTKHLNGTQPSLNDLITIELMEKVANFAQELPYSDTVLCYKLSAKSGSFVCVNITGTVTAESIHVSWQEHGFRILVWVIGFIALCYSPAILCLFKPTEVKTNDGIKIVLHGTSPVGIRSWIANFLSSHEDSITWKLGQSGVFLLFCIGVVFLEHKVIDVVLPPALLLGTATNSLKARFFLLTTCNYLLLIRTLVARIFKTLSFYAPCRICHFFGGRKNIVHADVLGHDYYGREEVIKMHLRIQPSIVLKCFKLLLRQYKCPSYAWEKLACLCCPLRVVVVVILAPLMVPLCLIFIIIVLFHSCPLTTFYDMFIYQSTRAMVESPSKAYPFVGFVQSLVIVSFSFVLVVEISCDLVSLIRGSLMRLPNILPVTCLIIVIAFCFWKCYISYPRKYNDLAIKLCEHYKAKTAKTQGRDNEAIPEKTQGNDKEAFQAKTQGREYEAIPEKTQGDDNEAFQAKTQGDDKEVVRIEGSTIEFPKDLFVVACEILMPRRESIGILLVKFILILFLVFILFAVIMETPGTNDTAKAIGTLLALLIPKFGEMCCSTDPQVARLDNKTLDKNVGIVVDTYISTRETETQNHTIKINNNDGDTSAENEGADQELNFSNEKTPLLGYGTFVMGEKSENTTTPTTTTPTRTITTKVAGCFLVLLLSVSYCIVVWVLFTFF